MDERPIGKSHFKFRIFLFYLVGLSMRLWGVESTADTNSFVEELIKKSPHGMVVLVGEKGKVITQHAVGFSDDVKNIPVTFDTKFRIGSVTKQFTAAAILKLVEDGKLKLDDNLSLFYPQFPSADKITIHHLLTHSSGIHSYTEKEQFYSRVQKPIKPESLIQWIQNDPLDFPPGTNFHYNNSAYFILGEIISKLSGKSYGEYLEKNFFTPLDMKSTGVYQNQNPPEKITNGYSWKEGKSTSSLNWDMSWAGSAGSLYSTASDLMLWNEGLYSGKILKIESLEKMLTINPLPDGVSGLVYSYGLGHYQRGGVKVIGHSGGLDGWVSNLEWFPATQTSIVVLCNAKPCKDEFDPGFLSDKISRFYFQNEIKNKVFPAMLQPNGEAPYVEYLGKYDYGSEVQTISETQGHLFALLTGKGQGRCEMFQMSKDVFFFKVVDAEIDFKRDSQGKVIAIRHTQNGNVTWAPRLNENPNMPKEALQEIVGVYQVSPEMKMAITEKNGMLFTQLTGQSAFRIYPTGPLEFELHAVKARLVFSKNAEGKIIKVTLYQNGREIDWVKN